MDLTGYMTELGYFYNGAPRGFSISGGQLTIWSWDEPYQQAADELNALGERLLARHFIQGAGRLDQTFRQGAPVWCAPLSLHCLVDVEIVAEHASLAEGQMALWTQRGYRVKQVNQPDDDFFGLVIDTRVNPMRYSGKLPSYPPSGLLYQSWH